MVLDQGHTIDGPSLRQSIVEDLSQIVALLGLTRLEKVVLETRVEAGELGSETFDILDERIDRVFPEFSNTECLGSSTLSRSNIFDKVGDEVLLSVSLDPHSDVRWAHRDMLDRVKSESICSSLFQDPVSPFAAKVSITQMGSFELTKTPSRRPDDCGRLRCQLRSPGMARYILSACIMLAVLFCGYLDTHKHKVIIVLVLLVDVGRPGFPVSLNLLSQLAEHCSLVGLP